MNHEPYLFAAYIISLGLLWGYAIALFFSWRSLNGRPGNTRSQR